MDYSYYLLIIALFYIILKHAKLMIELFIYFYFLCFHLEKSVII